MSAALAAPLPSATVPPTEATLSAAAAALVRRHLPLVKSVVHRLAAHLPAQVSLADLHSVGLVGLIHAAQRYSARDGHTFEAYAVLRIRGAILDELRRLDHLPRTARAKARQLHRASDALEQRLHRAPTEAELQNELGLDGRSFRRLQFQASPVTLVSLDAPRGDEDDDQGSFYDCLPDPQWQPSWQGMQQTELVQLLATELQHLPERQQKILALYYYEGYRLAEIAEAFGVTEARICQIHAQALTALRRRMERLQDA